jgi:Ca2+-binding EF-hand superfamily protein
MNVEVLGIDRASELADHLEVLDHNGDGGSEDLEEEEVRDLFRLYLKQKQGSFKATFA